jgi:phosphoribosylanthranilate isomerase
MLLTKVCGMKNRENIRALLRLKPDFIGFIFYPKSPRYVDASIAHSLTERIPSDVKKVGVFVNSSIEEIMDKVISLRLDYVQLSGTESLSFVKKLHHANIPIIKGIHVDEEEDLKKAIDFSPFISKFLFDTKTDVYGGSGLKFDWNILQSYLGDVPFFLSGGIGLPEVDDLLNFHHPLLQGVDINSKFEIEPGIKNTELIHKFLNIIRGTYEL